MTGNGKPGEEPPTTPQGVPEQGWQQPVNGEEPTRGQMRYQDPESTTPREPTLAEQRARKAAEQRRQEAEAAARAEAERKTQARRRVLIGGGATVGVVALVAAFYTGSAYSAEANAATAVCSSTDQANQTTAEADQDCDENYVRTHGGHYDSHTGLFFLPFFLPGGGTGWHQYRYSYMPSGSTIPSPGQRISTPNFTKPDASTMVKTRSGSTIQRGGFGISGKSGSGS